MANGENFHHSRKELNDLISDAIDIDHVDPDEMYIAVMRIVGVEREKKIKESKLDFWEDISELDYPTGD